MEETLKGIGVPYKENITSDVLIKKLTHPHAQHMDYKPL